MMFCVCFPLFFPCFEVWGIAQVIQLQLNWIIVTPWFHTFKDVFDASMFLNDTPKFKLNGM
jgi:hypothetical protein